MTAKMVTSFIEKGKYMKRRTVRATALLIILILTASVCLTSCTSVWDSLSDRFGIYDESFETEQETAAETETTDGEENIATEIINNTINNITVDGTENSVAYASATALRSAVSIYCLFEVQVGGNSIWNPIPTTQQYYSTGSGVIYTLDAQGNAFIVTNYHVVYSSNSSDGSVSDDISVYLYGLEDDAYAIPATFVGGSPNYDIAVLRVDNNEVLKAAYSNGTATAVKVADSDEIVPGQTTMAIGNPSATAINGISVTRGVVSVDSEYIQMSALEGNGQVSFRVIRTDTPVNSGNSGGGLFNDRGELVGIVNAKSSITDIDSIGYAIPSNVARAIADNIIDNCYGKATNRVLKGVFGGKIGATRMYTEYNTETGVLVKKETVVVTEITSGGICAGLLEQRDVIKSIKIGDKTMDICRQYQVNDAMFDVRIGDEITFVIERNGVEMPLTKTVDASMVAQY